MTFRTLAKSLVRNRPRSRSFVRSVDERIELARHSLAGLAPAFIRPRRRRLTIAVTARCNVRCLGCRYGRDFMPGAELPYAKVREVLEDAAATGYSTVRLYGGEPLLHPDLPRMVADCRTLGLNPYVTTNGILLEHRFRGLYEAGLRDVTIGFYGVGQDYDRYVQTPGSFRRLERSLAAIREDHGAEVDLQMNWLLMRPTCSVESFREARSFAERFGMRIQIDLIQYSLPYFQEGPDRELQFTASDRPVIDEVVAEMLQAKSEHPALINQSAETLRSIPDWLIKGPKMRVPCTAYDMIWIGADGSVQLCYVTFRLGNVHARRLRDLVGTPEHLAAARSAFSLQCPNCHCQAGDRIMRHRLSRKHYAAPFSSGRRAELGGRSR
jgi:cyclic pyranopterin phosphate synthase